MTLSLNPGARLGPYEIVGPLGAGGMGEVYDARDTRLDRAVAIKILRAEFAGSPDRRARFEREARAIASLNHPHICTLHDIGYQDGVDFLVMERLDGQTLADRLARGPLPFAEALECAGQIADALDRAHGQGILHRDLKPANVMLTRSGVKLLDFGLARLFASDANVQDALTRAGTLTTEGAIVGTLQYMAPEQLEGKPTDARSDLFAFGAILYEMVTGRRAFDAPSQAGIVGAILHAEVPPVASAPPAFARVLTACLAKKPEDRWSSAHDVRLLLQGIVTDSGVIAAPAPAARSGMGRGVWLVLAAALAAGLVAAAVVLARRPATQFASPDVLSIVPPAGSTFARGEAPAVSPDDRHVAFVAVDLSGRTQLYVRSRLAPTSRPLPGSDDAGLPFWAPDSRRLGFFARGSLKTVAIDGGAAQTLAPAVVPRGGSWSRDDVILYSMYPNEPLRQISASGGASAPVKMTMPAPSLRWFPSFLPDGRHYLYLAIDLTSRLATGINVASLESAETREIVPANASGVYAEPGYLLFRRDAALVAQPFDARTFQLTGSATVVADNIGLSTLGYQVSASASSGALVYQEPEPGWQLVWFDRTGKRLGPALPRAGQYNGLCFLHDGARVVYDMVDVDRASSNQDIWLLDVSSGATTRLTFDPSVDFYPVCSPTGDEIIFASLRAGPPNLFRQTVTAPGSEALILQTPSPKIPTDWSRDGRLTFTAHSGTTGWDIWTWLVGRGNPEAMFVAPAEVRNARRSPNGRFIAYTLVKDERSEVYVEPFPPTGAKWQVSRDGGQHPLWNPDGRTLYYASLARKIMAVEVSTDGPTFTTGPARLGVDTHIAFRERINQGTPYAVTPDGQRILVSDDGDTAGVPITVVLNWQALLEK